MADPQQSGGGWDPTSLGALIGAATAAIVAAAIKLRGVFSRPAPEPTPVHVDTSGLLDVIARLGAALRERDAQIDALTDSVAKLDKRLRESERLHRETRDRVRTLELEIGQLRAVG